MLVLDTTTKSLQILLGGAVTTNQLPFVASYTDVTTTTYVPGESDGATNGTTPVTLVGVPGASTQRQVKELLIQNADTVSAKVTIRYNNNGTTRDIYIATLSVGDQLMYNDAYGFVVNNNTGQFKTTTTTAGATPAVVLGSAAAAGVATTFLRTDDTIAAFDGTTPVNIAAAGATGTLAFSARSNHTHTIGTGIVTRTMLEATGKNWQFLGTATGATTTVGPVVWAGTFQQFQIYYFIAGYNGGTPVGRLLLGAASISTTALTNGSSLSEGVTAPTAAQSIPGVPLAVTLSAISRQGVIFVDGASGSFKRYEILGQNGNQSVSATPTMFRAAGNFSDLGTNLALQRAQLTVYDTLVATAASAQTFTAGTYFAVWGRNSD